MPFVVISTNSGWGKQGVRRNFLEDTNAVVAPKRFLSRPLALSTPLLRRNDKIL